MHWCPIWKSTFKFCPCSPSSSSHSLLFEGAGTEICKQKTMTCWWCPLPPTSPRAPSGPSLEPSNTPSVSPTPLCTSRSKTKTKLASHYGRNSPQVWTSATRLWQANASCLLSRIPAFVLGPLNSHCCWLKVVRSGQRGGTLNAVDGPAVLFIQRKNLGIRKGNGGGSALPSLLGCWTFYASYFLVTPWFGQERHAGRMRR